MIHSVWVFVTKWTTIFCWSHRLFLLLLKFSNYIFCYRSTIFSNFSVETGTYWNFLHAHFFFVTFQQFETFQCSLDFDSNILIHWTFFQCICLPIFHFSFITWVIISKQKLWRQRTKICIIWWLKSMKKYLISSILEYFHNACNVSSKNVHKNDDNNHLCCLNVCSFIHHKKLLAKCF